MRSPAFAFRAERYTERMTELHGRIPIRFERWYALLSSALLLFPSDSYVEIREDEVECRMGWAFRARFPRSAVSGAKRLARWPLSRGVHGFSGRWLVNGSGDGILSVELEPVQRCRVLGVPVKLRELLVSVDDPEALAERLRS
jgi:hypothetical protein